MAYHLFLPFAVGLLSGLHCLGMCGGIVGALSLSLPPEVRGRKELLLGFVTAHNIGRVAAYALAGTLAGWFGQALVESASPRFVHALLQAVAGAVLVAGGLHLAGWFPQWATVERLGAPLWQRLQGRVMALLQAQTGGRAMLMGFVWGWFPCGLVYAALPLAAATTHGFDGALVMVAFGLGTLPVMLATGILAGRMMALRRSPRVRQVAGVVIILMGLGSPFLVFDHATDPFGTGAAPVGRDQCGSQQP